MAGLAWYYLLAAMLNAAAAAYVAYMEMVSEGASRVGLAPRTRRLPDWLVIALLRALRPGDAADPRPRVPARRRCGSPTASAPWPTSLVAIAAGADAAHFAEVQDARARRGSDDRRPPSLDDHHPGRRARRADQPDALDPDLGGRRGDLPGDGHHLHPRAARSRCRSSSATRSTSSPGPTTFFVGATLGFIAMIAYRRIAGQRPGRLGDRQPVPALLRPEHDRLRLPRHRHQARQRADRRPDRPGRLLHLARPPPRGDQRRADGAGPAEPRGARAREDADLARPGLHRADRDGRPDDLPGRLGDRPPGPPGAAGQLDRRPPTRRRPPGTSSASRRCSSTSTPGWPASSCRA